MSTVGAANDASLVDRLAALERRVRELEDAEEIFALVAAYHRWCDGGWGHVEDGLVAATVGEARGTHDGDRVAELFVEDGTYSAIHPEAGQHPHFPGAHGRENIRALVNSWRDAEWTIHYSTNPIIRVDGDRATGEFKGVMWLRLDQVRPMHVIYRGDFVRTAEGWRIQSLRWLNANPPVGTVTAADGGGAMIVVRFVVRCRPERIDEVAAALAAAEAASRGLPGVVHFDVTRSVTDPDMLIVVEAFADRAAMERQNALPEAAEVMKVIESGAHSGYPEWTVWDASALDRSPSRMRA